MIDRQLPYQIATNIYYAGIECDMAARKIRQLLPAFLSDIRSEIKEEMKQNYDTNKETKLEYGL